MTISLPSLPYATDALAPHISAATLNEHHGAHHKSYVDKVNAAITDGPLADKPLESIILSANTDNNAKLFNSAAQSWNHGFYWNSLSPAAGMPSEDLASAIAGAFGSHTALLDTLKQAAVDQFGSGWAWLIVEVGLISVIRVSSKGSIQLR